MYGQPDNIVLIETIADGAVITAPPDVSCVQVSASAVAVGSDKIRTASNPGQTFRVVGGADGVRINGTAFEDITYDDVMLSAPNHVLLENDVLTLERVRKIVDGQSVLYWREVGLLSFGRTIPVTRFRESVVTSPAAAFTALATTIPANAILVGARLRFDGAITLVTAVKVGLGVEGNPDSILLSGTTMTSGTVTIGQPLTDTGYAAETTLRIAACDTNGAAAGTLAGTVVVDVAYIEVRE